MNANVQAGSESVNHIFTALLERDGYQISGRRARCPHCTGSRRLTVAIGASVTYCHRCKRWENVRSLSRKFNIAIPEESAGHRDARRRAGLFAEWVATCERMLLAHLGRLRARARWARVALVYDVEHEQAWTALANFYHQEAELMAALDMLSFAKLSPWVERPIAAIELFKAFEEAHSDA